MQDSKNELGRRLKRTASRAKQPTAEDIGKVYALVSHAVYPHSSKTEREPWKIWTPSERERFWRAFLFLGYSTGLRIGDLRRLEWSHVFADRIEYQPSKTGTPHVFAVTPDIQRHLDMARGLDPISVLPIPKWSVRFVRRELTRLCMRANVECFSPHMIRRAAVTECSSTAASWASVGSA